MCDFPYSAEHRKKKKNFKRSSKALRFPFTYVLKMRFHEYFDDFLSIIQSNAPLCLQTFRYFPLFVLWWTYLSWENSAGDESGSCPMPVRAVYAIAKMDDEEAEVVDVIGRDGDAETVVKDKIDVAALRSGY